MDFSDIFSAETQSSWEAKIQKDLRGGTIEELNWESELGKVSPILFNYKNKFARVDPNPHQINNHYLITQSFYCNEPVAANKEILKALYDGVNSLHLKSITLESLETVLEGIMLDIIATTIVVDSGKVAAFESKLNEYCQAKGWNRNNFSLKVVSDSIGQYVLNRAEKKPLETHKIMVWGCLYGNCGASIVNEIGFTLAHAHEYLHEQIEKGILPNVAAQNIEFQIAVGNSYFAEIAKIRAFRVLWNTILSSYGINNHTVFIHCENSNLYLSNLDLHNNLLRGTASAMASILGGANSVEVLRYDHNLSDKQSDASRLSKNILLILQEESYFNQVKEAAGGSYYIEQLTDLIIEKSWGIFQKIESEGGFLAAFEKGIIAREINVDLTKKKKLFEARELVLVGTNKYLNKQEKQSEAHKDIVLSDKFLSSYRLAQLTKN